ncbi:hypothetical protein [Fructobacillus cardui]|jgi:hypothetical protein|uniref:Uncharacterized protein n=1 Tax=Fructobacillus cardui TaxID=2893170 RepID=A0ABN9Z007_9LACO|nr:hypothetical protein [uncultured Fructobacillus sp.]CAK1235349.1 unnamed protein product [Fructobacillus cardui]CAK1239655.1 unnamed protein product [Fructobacillus cardui]CAK1254730.1 unnamed protein product [Fructobacillus cardui]
MKNKITDLTILYPRTVAIVLVTVLNIIYILLVNLFSPGQSLLGWLNSLVVNVAGFAVLMVLSWLWAKFVNRKK